MIEPNLHLKDGFSQVCDFACADAAVQNSHAQFVAHGSAMHFEYVLEPAALQPHVIWLISKIIREKKNKIQ